MSSSSAMRSIAERIDKVDGKVDGAVRFGQGTIVEWDPDTFENRVDWNGTVIPNLPVKSATDALAFKPGDHVILLGYRGTWWIDGLAIVPGAGSSERVVQFMQTNLAKQIAREIISEGVEIGVVPDEEGIPVSAGEDSGFIDLDTTGPSVTFTTETGKWLVLLVTEVDAPGDEGSAARMGYTASGAQSIAADNARSSLAGLATGTTTGGFLTPVYANVHEGSPGEITVTAKYRAIASSSFPAAPQWRNRALIVISF